MARLRAQQDDIRKQKRHVSFKISKLKSERAAVKRRLSEMKKPKKFGPEDYGPGLEGAVTDYDADQKEMHALAAGYERERDRQREWTQKRRQEFYEKKMQSFSFREAKARAVQAELAKKEQKLQTEEKEAMHAKMEASAEPEAKEPEEKKPSLTHRFLHAKTGKTGTTPNKEYKEVTGKNPPFISSKIKKAKQMQNEETELTL